MQKLFILVNFYRRTGRIFFSFHVKKWKLLTASMKLEENFPTCWSVFFTLSERPTSRSHSPIFKPKLHQPIRRDRLFRDTWKHFCSTSIFQICDQIWYLEERFWLTFEFFDCLRQKVFLQGKVHTDNINSFWWHNQNSQSHWQNFV